MSRLLCLKSFADVRLRRIFTSSRFIPEVDGFRFLSIVIVVISHVYVQCGPVPIGGSIAAAFHRIFEDGKRGVYLFFTISGFILGLPFARNHLQQGRAINLKSYFRRRVTRLEPPYIVAMVGRFLGLVVYKGKLYTFARLSMRLMLHFLYLNGLIYAQYPVIKPSGLVTRS